MRDKSLFSGRHYWHSFSADRNEFGVTRTARKSRKTWSTPKFDMASTKGSKFEKKTSYICTMNVQFTAARQPSQSRRRDLNLSQ